MFVNLAVMSLVLIFIGCAIGNGIYSLANRKNK